MPVKRLIISMSLPMMVSMLVQALYNVVDSIFVARLSEQALTAVTLAFPLQNLMIAVSSGTGVGVNAILSKSLGEKRFDRSDKAANSAVLLAFCNFVLFFVIGFFFAGAFIRTQTDNVEIAEMATTYLRIVTCVSAGIMYQMMFERLLQSTGKTVYSMISQMTGAIINIILDPIMIFGLLGMPAMGVAGAAIATCIGQIIAALLGFYFNIRKNTELHYSLKSVLHPSGEIIRRIYAVGIPSILMISIGSLMTYLMNLILIAFSTTATAVFGVYFKLQSFVFMPVFGLNNGLIPVLAYNYGARRGTQVLTDAGFRHHDLRYGPFQYHSGDAPGLLQRLPGNGEHRYPGAPDHQFPFSAGCSRHRSGIDLSGVLKKHLFADPLAVQTARRPHSLGLAPGPDGDRHQCLVLIPDRGGGVPRPLADLLQKDLQGGRFTDGAALTL